MQKKALDQNTKRKLLLGAIGLGVGGATGALIHPLVSKQPNTQGYLSSAIVGSSIGVPAALLAYQALNKTTSPVARGINYIVDYMTGLTDSAVKGVSAQTYNPSQQGQLSDATKTGQTHFNLVRSFLPSFNQPLLTSLKLGGLLGTSTIGRFWSPFDHIKKGDWLDFARSTRAARKRYVQHLVRTNPASFTDVYDANGNIDKIKLKNKVFTLSSATKKIPLRDGTKVMAPAKKYSKYRSVKAGALLYSLMSLGDFALNPKYKNVN